MGGAKTGAPGRWAAPLARLAWMALLTWLIMRTVGLSLRNPVPFCAWRFTVTSRSWMSLAWADANVARHAMLLYLNEGEQFMLEGESLPYARLFSFQTFGLLGRHAHGEIKDHQIIPQHGPNVFADLSAAANGEKQGGFRIHLTAQGRQNLTNEVAALGPGRRSGFFILVFRVVEVGDISHPRAPLAHLSRGAPDYPERWGWAPPPKLAVRRVGARRRGAWREIPQCSLQPRADLSLAFLDKIHDLLPSIWEYTAFIKANRKNNMHLQRAPLFAHSDTRSLASAADVSQIEAVPDGDLWARLTAKLPRTPRSLYAKPFISNHTDYDVRYISFTSVSRAFPLRSYHTLTDKHIRQHYQNQLKGPGQAWDGQFVMWIGPEGASLPDQAKRENALIMRWGEKQGDGGPINFPALLYNQLLSRSQSRDEVAEVDFTKGQFSLADIVPDVCPMDEVEKEDGEKKKPRQRTKGLRKATPTKNDDDENDDEEDEETSIRPLRERVCCGHNQLKEIPGFCRMPEFLHLRMRSFYPAVTFFIHQEADKRGPAQLRKLSV